MKESHMMHGVVRMGLQPSQGGYGSAYGAYGSLALQSNPGHYGSVRWLISAKKRSQCRGYARAVQKYNEAEEDHKRKGCLKMSYYGLRRGKCKDTARRMKAAKEEGKNAWKKCRARQKSAKKGWSEVPLPGGAGGGMVDPLTGMPMDTSMVGGEIDEGGIGSGVWYALGGLLLVTGGVVAYKKYKKGRKGRRR